MEEWAQKTPVGCPAQPLQTMGLTSGPLRDQEKRLGQLWEVNAEYSVISNWPFSARLTLVGLTVDRQAYSTASQFPSLRNGVAVMPH